MKLPKQIDTPSGYAVLPVLITTDYEEDYCYGYGPGNALPGTCFDASVAAAQLASTPLSLDDYTMITTFSDEETLQSSVYQEAKQRFIARTSFLWGDLEAGGGFIAYFNGGIHFGVVYGFFERDNQGTAEFRYFIGLSTYSGTAFTPGTCDEILIALNEDFPDNENYPSLMAIVKDPTAQLFNRYAEVDVAVFVGYGEKIPAPNLATASNDPSAYAILWIFDVVPNKIWGGCIDQRIITLDPEGTLLYGAWHGNGLIDISLNPGYQGGLSDPSTGPGAFPDESRDGQMTDPNGSGIDAMNSGFITLYNPTKAAIRQFNNFLFSDSITEALSTALKKLIADPIDYLVFIAMVRYKPPVADPTLQPICFCGINSGVSSLVVSQQATWIKYQTRHIDKSYNGFEDWNPYSKASIHLPYIGWKELNIDEVMDSDIKVNYIVDNMTGSCVAQVHVFRSKRNYLTGDSNRGDTKLNDVMYEFTGNCFEMMPLNATDFRGLFGSIMQTAVGVGASLASGNPIGAGAALINGAASAKVNVEHSGNMSASAGYFGSQDVYIRLERPIQSLPENYPNRQGMPSNVFCRKISDLVGCGYSEFEPESLVLDSLTDASLDEIEEIRSLLSSGMIF